VDADRRIAGGEAVGGGGGGALVLLGLADRLIEQRGEAVGLARAALDQRRGGRRRAGRPIPSARSAIDTDVDSAVTPAS
jgi:hypothetical protein